MKYENIGSGSMDYNFFVTDDKKIYKSHEVGCIDLFRGRVEINHEWKLFDKERYGDKINCIPLQFTGLKDKNGAKIYIGHVVKVNQVLRPTGINDYRHNVEYLIIYKYNQFFSEIIRNFDGACYYYGYVLDDLNTKCQIIGDISTAPGSWIAGVRETELF